MRVYVLGTGTSTGVPMLGCGCEVCRSVDEHDKRLRCSSLVSVGGTNILIDCGPDFREQMLRIPFMKIDAVLLTHEHYDHVGGLDDLRPYSVFGDVEIYADEMCAKHIQERIPYCFIPKDKRYPGVPSLNVHIAEPGKSIYVNDVEVVPLRVMHGKLPIMGYRIGDLGYVTDMSSISEEEEHRLYGVKCLIVNALRKNPHPSHQTLDEAVAFARRVGAEKTYFVHMSHDMGLHAVVNSELPGGMELAYDGMVIDVN